MLKKQKKKHVSHTKRKSGYIYFKKISITFFVAVAFYATTTLLFTHSASKPTCANSKSCASDLSLKIENNVPGYFQGKKLLPPSINGTESSIHPVLGAQTSSGEKHIYVDLGTQTLYAYQGQTLILKTLVASGKWGRTPVGNFHVWEKLRATRMSGGEGSDAYDLPNVPYVMYFYHDFGLHGAYWHDNFGHPMSHGCVNLRAVDAKILFEWADGPQGNTPGTAVSICDQITPTHQCIQNNPIQ